MIELENPSNDEMVAMSYCYQKGYEIGLLDAEAYIFSPGRYAKRYKYPKNFKLGYRMAQRKIRGTRKN